MRNMMNNIYLKEIGIRGEKMMLQKMGVII